MSEQHDPVQSMVDAMLASEEAKSDAPTQAVVEDGDRASEDDGLQKADEGTSAEVEEEKERLVPASDLSKEIAGRAKLRAERRQLREENAKLKAELESLKGNKVPDVDDFETAEEYEEALKKHEQQVSQPVSVTFVEARTTLLEQKDDWDDAPEDWMEVVSDNALPFTEKFIIEVSDLENGTLSHLCTRNTSLLSVYLTLSSAQGGIYGCVEPRIG
jgi:hypothetical protein